MTTLALTWLTPQIAALAAAIAVPTLIILYFLKLRRRDVEISSTLLWKKSIQDLQANAPFQKLRRNILLLLQLLALAAALFALAQPQLAGQASSTRRHVIVIDRSASMSTRDEADTSGNPISRLDKAKLDALAIIDNLRAPDLFDRTTGQSGDEAMVLAFDASARALQAFTTDKAALRDAVNAIMPTDAPTSADEAFRLIRAQAPRVTYTDPTTGASHDRPGGPVGTIHLLTDGNIPDLAKVELGPEDPVLYTALGKPDTPNLAITSLRAGRSIDDPQRLSIFVGLQSTFATARTVNVDLEIDGAPVQIRPIELDAAKPEPAPEGQTPRLTAAVNGTLFTLDRPQGGIVTVRLRSTPADAFSTDDAASVVAPPSKALSVAIVTTGNLFLREALSGLPLARLDTLTPEQFEADRAKPQPTNYDVVVLDGVLPTVSAPDPAAAPPLPPGRWLIFNATPTGPLGLADIGEAATPTILDWSRDHPALRGLTFDAVLFAKARKLEIPPAAAARSLISGDQGPLLVELSAGDAKALVLPFNLMDTTWGFDLSYVLFMAQAVQYLGDDSAGINQSIQPGTVFTDRIPPTATNLRVRTPATTDERMGDPAPDGRVAFGPITTAGIYTVSWDGPPGPTDATQGSRALRPFAANLLDPAESAIATQKSIALPTKVAEAQDTDAATASTLPLWPFLIMGMLALLILEWYIYNRKVHL